METSVSIKIEPDLVIEDNNYSELTISNGIQYHITTNVPIKQCDDNKDQLISILNTKIKTEFSPSHINNNNNNNNNNSRIDPTQPIPTTVIHVPIDPCTPQPPTAAAASTKIKKIFKCTECDRTFPYVSPLNRHMMQVHAFERPYKCDICERTFIDKSTVKMHMQVHSGIRPYRCKICNKPFGHPFNIKKHMLVHSGLRPYKCSECGKTYKHSSHLKRHMVHHDDGGDHRDTRLATDAADAKKKRGRPPMKIKSEPCDPVALDVLNDEIDIFGKLSEALS